MAGFPCNSVDAKLWPTRTTVKEPGPMPRSTSPPSGPAALADRMAAHAGEAAALLKALAHPARLLVLCQLVEGERTVGELQPATGLGASALSQHLAVL